MAIICHSSNQSSEYMKVTGEGVESGNISRAVWKLKFENDEEESQHINACTSTPLFDMLQKTIKEVKTELP